MPTLKSDSQFCDQVRASDISSSAVELQAAGFIDFLCYLLKNNYISHGADTFWRSTQPIIIVLFSVRK